MRRAGEKIQCEVSEGKQNIKEFSGILALAWLTSDMLSSICIEERAETHPHNTMYQRPGSSTERRVLNTVGHVDSSYFCVGTHGQTAPPWWRGTGAHARVWPDSTQRQSRLLCLWAHRASLQAVTSSATRKQGKEEIVFMPASKPVPRWWSGVHRLYQRAAGLLPFCEEGVCEQSQRSAHAQRAACMSLPLLPIAPVINCEFHTCSRH